MLRTIRVLTTSLAVLLVAGAMAPAEAHAWPFGKALHLHPDADQTKDAKVAFLLHNKGELAQNVRVDGTVYTVGPLQSVTIKAPAGAAVYADSPGAGHQRGELLYVVRGDLKDATVSFE
jgi:hypothetical protein